MNDKFILGDGIFEIAGIDVATTRGGGVFEVLKEYRQVEHDGARGEVVKNMTVLDRATPKLLINSLTILDGVDITKMYANIRAAAAGDVTTITGSFDILESDYQNVAWRGFLNTGQAARIELKNAINLENFNWALADKSEVIHTLNYSAAYERGSKEQPWKILFGTPASKELKVGENVYVGNETILGLKK